MKIDLHLHSSERSSCAHSTAEEMILAAKGFGLDAVCFTEHNRLTPEGWLADMNERHAPFRIFSAVEVGVTVYEHCLVLGVRDGELERPGWTYPDLWEFTRERGGHLTLCHPFRFADTVEFDIDRFQPDAIEVHSVHTATEDERLICETAGRVGARLVSSSDALYARWVGVFHVRLARPDAPASDFGPARGAGPAADEREGRARAILGAGGDAGRFREETGLSGHYFDRVARGRSYRV